MKSNAKYNLRVFQAKPVLYAMKWMCIQYYATSGHMAAVLFTRYAFCALRYNRTSVHLRIYIYICFKTSSLNLYCSRAIRHTF